ncbi:hypothetical protein VOLCADRAFT_85798 [Volvox carteri f. nagariensis]|uniref:Uncharacterized protein n=1 Tax=Volvox carteri f. nagariensis TaxID=3068 RepID=D8TH06_VOLCA|nr:uncharacterized protein VOLCADRAFT_85798 [Volvox carteri f. nagariensis]EFJ52987.1 hypothetical protein VOLCADRAFT_85798 [Volvox carteri f. nagariensis]|eukprot:XP_002945992.1 hypothetical protein VOLCADRAFT_85798 [Volvox carteri f. nagariensis]
MGHNIWGHLGIEPRPTRSHATSSLNTPRGKGAFAMDGADSGPAADLRNAWPRVRLTSGSRLIYASGETPMNRCQSARALSVPVTVEVAYRPTACAMNRHTRSRLSRPSQRLAQGSLDQRVAADICLWRDSHEPLPVRQGAQRAGDGGGRVPANCMRYEQTHQVPIEVRPTLAGQGVRLRHPCDLRTEAHKAPPPRLISDRRAVCDRAAVQLHG